MKLYGVIGYRNSGKTGLMERLVAQFTSEGLRVSTVKHAHHGFDLDQPGKDSYRHRAAGAGEVMIASAGRWALMHESEGEEPLEALVARLSPCDLVLVEGYKRDSHPRIEAHRGETGQPLIAPGDPLVRAVASDVPAEQLEEIGRPVFDLDDTAGIADFIRGELGL